MPSHFTPLSPCHVSPSSHLIALCPTMDLLACINGSHVLVLRLNNERIIDVEVDVDYEDDDAHDEQAQEEQHEHEHEHEQIRERMTPVTSVAWRPDGRALILALINHDLLYLSIEHKRFEPHINHYYALSFIKHMTWCPVSQAAAEKITAADKQDKVQPLSALPSGQPDESSSSHSILYDSSALLVACSLQQLHIMVGGTICLATFHIGQLLPKHHNAVFVQASIAAGTLSFIARQHASSIINDDDDGGADHQGDVSMAGSHNSHCDNVVMRHGFLDIHDICDAHTLQLTAKLHLLSSCIAHVTSLFPACNNSWSTARKSFTFKLNGLKEKLEEFNINEPDIQSEYIQLLLTGVSSPAMRSFITSYLSSVPWGKTRDAVASSLDSLHDCVTNNMAPLLQKITLAVEEIQALSALTHRWAKWGLDYQKLQEILNTLYVYQIHLHRFQLFLLQSQRAYAAFFHWFGAMIRYLNNEHDKAEEGETPYYGPYDVELVMECIQTHVLSDGVGSFLSSSAPLPPSLVAQQQPLQLPQVNVPTCNDVAHFSVLQAWKYIEKKVLSPFMSSPCHAISSHILQQLRQSLHQITPPFPLHSYTPSDLPTSPEALIISPLLITSTSSLVAVRSYASPSPHSLVCFAYFLADSPFAHLCFVRTPLSNDAAIQAARFVCNERAVRSCVADLHFYNDEKLAILIQYETPSQDEEEEATANSYHSTLYLLEVASLADLFTNVDFPSSASLLSTLPDDLPLHDWLSDSPSLTLKHRSFDNTLCSNITLSSQRGLGSLTVATKGAPLASCLSASQLEELNLPAFTRQLFASSHMPSKKIIMLDMEEDEEEEEDEEGNEEAQADEANEGETIEQQVEVDVEVNLETKESEAMQIDEETSFETPPRPNNASSSSSSSSSRAHSHVPLMLSLLCFLTLLLPVCASEGDMDYRFAQCLMTCHGRCSRLENGLELTPDVMAQWQSQGPNGAAPQPLPIWNRMMFWNCFSNCDYTCMHANVELRELRGEPTVKYYGKWPFKRVLGMQELFSVLFSIANFLPHIYWFRRLRREVLVMSLSASTVWPYLGLWNAYSLVACNTWVWSAVFHARDVKFTERMDYFCASIGIATSLATAIIRIFQIRAIEKRLLVSFPILLGLIAHISYLQFVSFDYGWNMKVSLCVGLGHSLLWLCWCALVRVPYAWKMLCVTLGLWLCASLEVYDFPPFIQLIDAHAMWHGLTPPLAYLFYSFLLDDAKQYQKTLNKIQE